MYKFQDESFAFLKDGNYPIDHNIAERAIRPPLLPQQNSMLHSGSDKGAEMAVDYHGIMSAVKL